MNASELLLTLDTLVNAKVPTFLWGASGIGKSSIVKQLAQKKEIQLIDLRLALMDPTDLKGIPFFQQKEQIAIWAAPSFLPREGKGILFLDELNSAPPSVQASAYQLILDRKVGDYILPDGWSIIAAGNRDEDKGVTYKMAAPLANRFVHLEMSISIDEWRQWAYKNNIDQKIISYLTFKNDHLYTFDPKLNTKSFATPRSWEYADKILKSNLPASLLLETLSGAISNEVAISFLNYIQVIEKLPDIQEIISTGNGKYPEEIDVLYALSIGLISSVLHNPSSLDNILKYTLQLKGEFSVLIVQELQKNGINMEHSSIYKEWVEKFIYLLD